MTVITAGLADQIVAAVHSVPGVIGLDAGSRDDSAEQLLGRSVPGLRISEFERFEVHIVVEFSSAVRMVADEVRDAVRGLVEMPVDVCVENVVDLELMAA